MRTHPGLFHLCFTIQSLAQGKDTTKYKWVNAWLKAPSNKGHLIMCSWDNVLGKRKGSDSKRICLWRFRRLLRTSARRKPIQDGKICVAKYFLTDNRTISWFIIATLTSLRIPCRFYGVHKIHMTCTKEKINSTFYKHFIVPENPRVEKNLTL